MTVGNFDLPSLSHAAYEIEGFASKILQSEGYRIISQPYNERQSKLEELKKGNRPSREPNALAQLQILGTSLVPRINQEKWAGFGTDLPKVYNSFKQAPSYVDYLCKKGKDYTLIDIKYKMNYSGPKANRFRFTNFEVLNYNRIVKEGKAKVKVLIFIGKSSPFYYRIFDWLDFAISPTFDPHKTIKVDAKLKRVLDVENFKQIIFD